MEMLELTSQERYLMMMDYIQKHEEKGSYKIKFKEEDLIDLINFLKKSFKAEVDYLISFERTIELSNENFELYLRSSAVPVQTLTIARIGVNPRGKGLGTAVIQEIIKFAKKVGFDRIVLESILTDEGIKLAERNGFEVVFQFDEIKEVFPFGPDSYELILPYEFNQIAQVRLKELMRIHNTNSYKIGKYVKKNYGVSFQSTLSEIMNGKSKMPTLTTIELVMESLDLPLYEFFKDWKFYYYRRRMKGNHKSSSE